MAIAYVHTGYITSCLYSLDRFQFHWAIKLLSFRPEGLKPGACRNFVPQNACNADGLLLTFAFVFFHTEEKTYREGMAIVNITLLNIYWA